MNQNTLVPVTVSAQDAGAQVIVVDASFQQLAIGVGRLELQLAPGIYKARFKGGDRIEDKLFEVRDQPVSVHGDALQFSSPIPLSNTSNNHEYHYYPSRDLAAAAPLASFGTGGEVFVFARDSRQELNRPPAGPPHWQGLSIHGADHGAMFDIGARGRSDVSAGYVSAKVSLAPGQYYLVQPDCTHPDMTTRLPFVVCDGWCTHVYVDSKDAYSPQSPSRSSETWRILDLAGAAMVMLEIGGARLDDEVGRLSEIARQGLMRGQETVSEADLSAMIYGKQRFPMLGLYAANVLLSRAEINWNQVAMIATNLSNWLGSGHPDVEVLVEVCRLHGATVPSRSFSQLWPPVLASSWDRATQNGIEPPATDARGDWLRQYRVGGTIWSCLFAPARLAEIAASGATPSRSFLTRSLSKVEGAAAAAQSIGERWLREKDVAWRDLLTDQLRHPDPDASPFAQAVRRRVLDLLSDQDEPLTLSNLDQQVESLARQFRVPVEQARDVLSQFKK